MRLILHIIFFSLILGNYSVIQSDSKVEYFGRHPMHGFSGSSSSITLFSECDKIGDLCDLMFKVPIISLNSGNDNRDSNMLNYLKAFSYPEVILSIDDFVIKEYIEEVIPCHMFISGMEQQVDVPLSLSKVSENQYKAETSFMISLNQFNIDIPKLLFIPIDNEIKINVEFLIEYQGE